MRKWEYMIFGSTDLERQLSIKWLTPDDIEKYITSLGSTGWEIIAFDLTNLEKGSFYAIAKRERDQHSA